MKKSKILSGLGVFILVVAMLITGCAATPSDKTIPDKNPDVDGPNEQTGTDGIQPAGPIEPSADKNVTEGPQPVNPSGPVPVKNLMAGRPSVEWPQPPTRLEDSFQAPMMKFSWNMFKSVLEDGGNTLISPTSIALALAMTMNGADQDTLSAMQEALSAQDLTQEDLNAACRDWISLLRTQTEKTTVSVANSIWFRQNYNVSHVFLDTNAKYFNAAIQALDFDSPEAVRIINDWVKKQTQGKIDQIVDTIDTDTIMYLINAVYFKSDWEIPFEASNTAEDEFKSPTGSIKVNYMNRTGEMKYLDAKGTKGVLLPYDNARFAFFALLPPEGQEVKKYIKGLDASQFMGLLHSMEKGQVMLGLPKFETRYENSLKDELTKLGMGVAFGPRANLSRINSEGMSELFIHDVIHKTFCRVDEKGTEAAAVTKVEIKLTSMPMPGAEIRFDRPFIYGILDQASGTPLFLGVMEKPAL